MAGETLELTEKGNNYFCSFKYFRMALLWRHNGTLPLRVRNMAGKRFVKSK